MKFKPLARRAFVATALLILSSPANAQDEEEPTETTSEQEDEGSFPFGLLGLLGLGGLLGSRRREPPIHVDARRQR